MEIIAAVIGGMGAVAAALVGGVVGRKRGRDAERGSLEKLSQRSAESLQADQGDRIGLTAESLKSHMVVKNGRGDARTGRSWRGVRATEGHTIARIPGRFFTATPDSSITAPPMLAEVDSPKQLELAILKLGAAECDFAIEIAGGLTSDDGPISYGVEVEYDHAVLMTESEVERAYADDQFKHDYFCFDIVMPLEQLELEISFSSHKPAELFPVVFWGNSEHEHTAELTRTRRGFDRTPNGARFTVDEPLFGFRYAIYWCFGPSRHRMAVGHGRSRAGA